MWPGRELKSLLFQALILQMAQRISTTCPRSDGYWIADQGPHRSPVLIWGLLIWFARMLWVDGTGTRSWLCPIQSGSIGSSQGVGKKVSGEFRHRVAPTYDQIMSCSPLVFGYLQDVDRRVLYSESKDPDPTLGSVFLPQVRWGIIYITVTFFSSQFFEFWKTHTVMHCHNNQDREQSHHPKIALCFLYSTFPSPWRPASGNHWSILSL